MKKTLKSVLIATLGLALISCQSEPVPGSGNENTNVTPVSSEASPSPAPSEAPAAATGNNLKIDGKAVKIGVNGKVTQATYGGLVANISFGGLPNGQPEGTQPGEYIGIVQLGGTISGDITIDKIEGMTLTVQEVSEKYTTGHKVWRTEFGKDILNTPDGPTLQFTAKDGKFLTLKATGKLTPDKGQKNLENTNDINVEFVFNDIQVNK